MQDITTKGYNSFHVVAKTARKTLRDISLLHKSLDSELKQVTFVAMLPGVDLHGDYVSAEEVAKAMNSFEESPQRPNLYHMFMTNSFSVISNEILKSDTLFGSHIVPQGSWIMKLQVYDDNIWQKIKTGDITGISIGAIAQVQDYDDE